MPPYRTIPSNEEPNNRGMMLGFRCQPTYKIGVLLRSAFGIAPDTLIAKLLVCQIQEQPG